MSHDSSTGLRGQEIVCLATQEWDANWTPVQQVMARLAPDNRVLYIEPFHAALSRLRNGGAVFQQQIRAGVPQFREVQPNLWVYRPGYPYLPWNTKSALSHFVNGRLFPRELSGIIARAGMRRPLLWAFFAQSLRVLDLDFSHIIYDCVDDWPSFFPDPVERSYISRIDEALTRRAELVFVGSDPLLEKKRHQNEKMFVVNHAADIPHFMKAAAAETPIPSDMERIPHPRIGFVGMIDTLRFDGDLIRRLAETPDHHIVIVGGFLGEARQLVPDRPNVHVLGMKKVAELPGYLKGMDVCMMPYKQNETTRYIFPLKLFEYLATGKPTVAMAIPAVEGLRRLVHVADTRDEFVSLVHRTVGGDNPQARDERIAYSRSHSWEEHLARKAALIQDHLALSQSESQ